VGHNEDALAPMGGSDVVRPELVGGRTVAESVQIGPHTAQVAALPRRDVLDDRDGWLEGGEDVSAGEPEAGAAPFESSPEAGAGHVLTGETEAAEVDGGKRGSCSNIGHAPIGVGPVPGEDGPAEGVDLHLPRDAVRDASLRERSAEAELQAADPAEEGAEDDHGSEPSSAARRATSARAMRRRSAQAWRVAWASCSGDM